jgi:Flp pilus assembly protein TadG
MQALATVLRRLTEDTAILRMALRMARSLWRDNVGSAIIEGAIVMPVLLLILGGVYEFSWIFYKQKLIEAGVRDAARYLSRLPIDPSTNPCVATDSSGNLYATFAKNIAVYGSTSTSGFSQRVNGWTTGDVTITPRRGSKRGRGWTSLFPARQRRCQLALLG